jgi:hypothetical protein
MNLFNIIDEIEKVDPEIHERLNPAVPPSKI